MLRLLLVDMDGVLCDYNEKLVNSGLVRPDQLTHERWKDCALSPEQVETIQRMVYSRGFFEDLKPIHGALESLEKLLTLGWNVYVCSRPPNSQYAWSEKHNWIQRYSPFLSKRIILTTCKALVRGDAFIDDSLQSLQEWSSGLKILLQTNPDLNYRSIPNDVLHFTNWADLLQHLQSLKQEG